MSDSARQDYAPPGSLARLSTIAFAIGGVAAVISALGLKVDVGQFFRSYLIAYLFWVGIALGCLAVSMVHHLSRGAWGIVIRRILEAASGTLPALAVLFVPIVLGLPHIFRWARPEEVAADELLQHKALYLNPVGFTGRAAAYFALWIFFAWMLGRLSLQQDETGDLKLFRRMQALSGPGLVLFVVLGTFASVDWLMSLDPHWFSSLHGVSFVIGQGLSALCFVVLVALWLSGREPMSEVLAPRHFHDLGKLMLAFVMIWAYFMVSQFLIIWSGNLPEEITWYLERTHGSWKPVSIFLVMLHFLLPFLLLLSRDLKRDVRRLAVVAGWLLVMRWLDLYWQAAPAFSHSAVPHWLDLTLLVALGGIWFGTFARRLLSRPLLPKNEPYLEEALSGE